MPVSTYAHGRAITPTEVPNDQAYYPVVLQDFRASTGDFTWVDTVGGLQVATAGMYQISAEIRWYGGSRMVGGWHAMRVRLRGPYLDGSLANDRTAQIDDWRTAAVQSGSGLQYLNAGDRLWIEAAHHSLRPSNVDGFLNIVLTFSAEQRDFYDNTEALGPFRSP